MATLGANAIRVYHVDPDADHTGCMTAFADVGIYTLIDLDTFTTYINPVRFLVVPCAAFANSFAERSIVEPDTV